MADVFHGNTGMVDTARLGSGSASSSTYLRGDQTWATVAASHRTLITLGSDVTTSVTTWSDVTGLSFSVSAGVTYRFVAHVVYSVPATTDGFGLAVNGPASPTLLAGRSILPAAQTSSTIVAWAAYDLNVVSSGSANVGNNFAELRGIIIPSAGGTLSLRFRSEAGSATTAKAGSTLEWW